METKPGYLTTEFWITMFTNVMSFGDLFGIWHLLPNKFVVILLAVINAAYAVSRGEAKKGIAYNPNQR